MNSEINKYLINKNCSIEEALKFLIEAGSKCLVVTDSNNKMVGTLSDGDLRKAILSGKLLRHKISKIFNKNPKYIKESQYTDLKAQNIFLKFLIDLIPIIDENENLIKVIKMDDVFKKKNITENKKNKIPVVIMAGGKGTRLQPFTSVLPKPLIPINDKPIIDHIIDKFKESGINEFHISVNYKSKILKSFFEEKKTKDKIHFIEEKKPLGTIGSLSKVYKLIKPIFFVTNSDIMIDCDYNDILSYHKKNKNFITIVASFRNYIIPYGDCKINKEGLLEKIKEKPKINLLASTGMYVINKEAIKYIPKNTKFDFNQLIDKLILKKKKIGIFPISEEAWLDIGQWNEYKKAINKLNFIN